MLKMFSGGKINRKCSSYVFYIYIVFGCCRNRISHAVFLANWGYLKEKPGGMHCLSSLLHGMYLKAELQELCLSMLPFFFFFLPFLAIVLLLQSGSRL